VKVFKGIGRVLILETILFVNAACGLVLGLIIVLAIHPDSSALAALPGILTLVSLYLWPTRWLMPRLQAMLDLLAAQAQNRNVRDALRPSVRG